MIFLAAAKNGIHSHGVELNTWLVQYSRLSAFREGVFSKTNFYRKDLWKFDVSPYKYIVIFGVEQMVGVFRWSKVPSNRLCYFRWRTWKRNCSTKPKMIRKSSLVDSLCRIWRQRRLSEVALIPYGCTRLRNSGFGVNYPASLLIHRVAQLRDNAN